MFKVGDTVNAKALNGEIFSGEIIALDRFNYAYVRISGASEARIPLSQLLSQLSKDYCDYCGQVDWLCICEREAK